MIADALVEKENEKKRPVKIAIIHIFFRTFLLFVSVAINNNNNNNNIRE